MEVVQLGVVQKGVDLLLQKNKQLLIRKKIRYHICRSVRLHTSWSQFQIIEFLQTSSNFLKQFKLSNTIDSLLLAPKFASMISHDKGITGFYEIFSDQSIHLEANLLFMSQCMISDFGITVDICSLLNKMQQLTGYCIDFNLSILALVISHKKQIIGFCEIFSVQFVHFAFFSFYLCSFNSYVKE